MPDHLTYNMLRQPNGEYAFYIHRYRDNRAHRWVIQFPIKTMKILKRNKVKVFICGSLRTNRNDPEALGDYRHHGDQLMINLKTYGYDRRASILVMNRKLRNGEHEYADGDCIPQKFKKYVFHHMSYQWNGGNFYHIHPVDRNVADGISSSSSDSSSSSSDSD